MLRSLFTAVTGVRAHQTMLDVTGNNISNANTTGFKKDNTLFADLMYQANKYASAAGDTKGGINPAQVGLGVSVSAIETIHTQGSGQYTGNASDMMVQDKGFFVYDNGGSQLFSRSGACVLDANSDMVMSGSGYKLQGYKMELQPATGEYDQAAELSTVNVPIGQKIDAHATSLVDFQCNLDSRQNAYLSYGFADMPFNVVAGAEGLSGGRASVPMNGTNYDLAFTTDFAGTHNGPNGVASDQYATGVNYLNVAFANGGETATLTFDMTGIDSDSGKPTLSLPSIADFNGTIDSSAELVAAGTLASAVTTNRLVGYINIADQTVVDASTVNGVAAADFDSYVPVYQLPGQVPPQYIAAQYDDDSGTLRMRKISLISDTTNNEVSSDVNSDFLTNMQTANTHIRIEPSAFTYNMKDKMNYSSFALSGSPTIVTTDATGAVVATPAPVTYNFIAEFDESVDRDAGTASDLSKSTSTLTLWYYGYSNADAATNAVGVAAGTAVQSMHKLEANVAFNADGTFDYVEWIDTTNDNAPMGFRIVDGNLLDAAGAFAGDAALANFQITAGSANAASSTKDTLMFMQAQSLDSPGSKENLGVWSTVGSESQGGFHATKTTIYDDNGNTHTLEVTFKKLTENRWRWEAFLVEQDESGNDVLVNIIPDPRTGEIEFDGSGRISNAIADGGLRRGDGQSIPNAEVQITLPFSLNGQPNSTVTLNFGGGVGSGGSALDGVTQFASETTTKPVYQDGYTMGVLKNYSVASNGIITGSYSNGVNIPLYRVALATFANEQGLEKVGGTMFQASVNSGNANIDGAESNGKGSIMSQYVEMSNVDLTEEFTHLIIAQRGFQANTRVVTVSDQILEEVVNLKR